MIQQLNNFLRIEYVNNGEKIEFSNVMKFHYAKKKKKKWQWQSNIPHN